MTNRRLYVLVCRDLKSSCQAVQAGHAVAEWLLHDQPNVWRNSTLIYLGVDNEDVLKQWTKKLTICKIKWVRFKKPDIGN